MMALQHALAVDMDARKDRDLARRQEAARLYEGAIEALEEALQRKHDCANVFSRLFSAFLARDSQRGFAHQAHAHA